MINKKELGLELLVCKELRALMVFAEGEQRSKLICDVRRILDKHIPTLEDMLETETRKSPTAIRQEKELTIDTSTRLYHNHSIAQALPPLYDKSPLRRRHDKNKHKKIVSEFVDYIGANAIIDQTTKVVYQSFTEYCEMKGIKDVVNPSNFGYIIHVILDTKPKLVNGIRYIVRKGDV